MKNKIAEAVGYYKKTAIFFQPNQCTAADFLSIFFSFPYFAIISEDMMELLNSISIKNCVVYCRAIFAGCIKWLNQYIYWFDWL